MSKYGWILAPLAGLYGVALRIRHRLYDSHLLRSHQVAIPTICVGNLAVGGTGKTPHVEYLIRLLSEQYRVAVLSRGYGRRSKGFVLADSDASADTIGDEPMQIHQHFPHVPVAVCEDRVRGIRQLQRRIQNRDVIILDDAFQHRRLRCGLNILLTEYTNLYVDDHLLPWGRLRDLKSRSVRANIIVVTKCPERLLPIDCRVVENQLRPAAFQRLYFSHIRYADLPRKDIPLIVTGIACPEPMVDYVRQQHPSAGHIAFMDHHRFIELDIDRIVDTAREYDYVLTTEKDHTRLAATSLPNQLGERLCVLPISIEINQEFDQQVLRYVAETLRKLRK